MVGRVGTTAAEKPRPATVIVRRPRRYFGFAVPFAVIIDRRRVARLWIGGRCAMSVDPGEHVIEIRGGLTRGRTDIRVPAGETTPLIADHQPGFWRPMLEGTIHPRRALSIDVCPTVTGDPPR